MNGKVRFESDWMRHRFVVQQLEPMPIARSVDFKKTGRQVAVGG